MPHLGLLAKMLLQLQMNEILDHMHLSIYLVLSWNTGFYFGAVCITKSAIWYFNTTCNKYNVSKQMGGLLTGNLCRTYFWSDLHSVCILYLSRLSIYLYFFGINCMIKCFMKNRIVYYLYRLHVISTLLYLYKCKCAKFLSSSLYSMDCFILLASFCQFEIWSSPYISLSTLFALICYHWSRKWQSRYIEHLIIHTRLVWMYSIKINRLFFKKVKKIYIYVVHYFIVCETLLFKNLKFAPSVSPNFKLLDLVHHNRSSEALR